MKQIFAINSKKSQLFHSNSLQHSLIEIKQKNDFIIKYFNRTVAKIIHNVVKEVCLNTVEVHSEFVDGLIAKVFQRTSKLSADDYSDQTDEHSKIVSFNDSTLINKFHFLSNENHNSQLIF